MVYLWIKGSATWKTTYPLSSYKGKPLICCGSARCSGGLKVSEHRDRFCFLCDFCLFSWNQSPSEKKRNTDPCAIKVANLTFAHTGNVTSDRSYNMFLPPGLSDSLGEHHGVRLQGPAEDRGVPLAHMAVSTWCVQFCLFARFLHSILNTRYNTRYNTLTHACSWRVF